MYRILDTNRTGKLETTELVKLARDSLGISNAEELFQSASTSPVYKPDSTDPGSVSGTM